MHDLLDKAQEPVLAYRLSLTLALSTEAEPNYCLLCECLADLADAGRVARSVSGRGMDGA